ncbi:hypothetical protein FF38_13534 [Lucilia cuprina]|uniref:Uncharacterized protein n=1 Tax=Lucilia cuprina TaxID=7375 RepID=A0A0L0BQ44_LUCCU|nr:hypothetical protein CVS40_7925 [Lucilia cuprina]KNC22098.1 hypothetical protein FF38_13534 [Lucilia cuprina]
MFLKYILIFHLLHFAIAQEMTIMAVEADTDNSPIKIMGAEAAKYRCDVAYQNCMDEVAVTFGA